MWEGNCWNVAPQEFTQWFPSSFYVIHQELVSRNNGPHAVIVDTVSWKHKWIWNYKSRRRHQCSSPRYNLSFLLLAITWPLIFGVSEQTWFLFDLQHSSTTNLRLFHSKSLYNQERLPVFPRRKSFPGDLGRHQHSGKLVLHLDWCRFGKQQPSDPESPEFALPSQTQ